MSDTPIPTSDEATRTGSTEGTARADRRWEEFQRARGSLAEVMDDDELRDLGFDLDVLDSRP